MNKTLLTYLTRQESIPGFLAPIGKRILMSIVKRPFGTSASLYKKCDKDPLYKLDEEGLKVYPKDPTDGSVYRLKTALESLYGAIMKLKPGVENKEKPYTKIKTNAPVQEDKSLRWHFKGKKNPKYVAPPMTRRPPLSESQSERVESDSVVRGVYAIDFYHYFGILLVLLLGSVGGFLPTLLLILLFVCLFPDKSVRTSLTSGQSPPEIPQETVTQPKWEEDPNNREFLIKPQKTNLKLLPNLRKMEHVKGPIFRKLKEMFNITWRTGSGIKLWGWRNRKQNKYLKAQYTRLMNLRGEARNRFDPYILKEGGLNPHLVDNVRPDTAYWNLAYFLVRHSTVFRAVYFNHCFGRWEKNMLFGKVLDILYDIEKKVRDGSWTKLCLSRVWIDGGKRPLGVPSSSDRVIGAQLAALLEFYVTGTIQHNHAYQFLKGTGTAWHQMLTNLIRVEGRDGGLPFLYEYDIVGFFNELDHKLLMKGLKLLGLPSWLRLGLLRIQQSAPQQSEAKREAAIAKVRTRLKENLTPLPKSRGEAILLRRSDTGGEPLDRRMDKSPVNKKYFVFTGNHNPKGVAQGHNLSPLLSILLLDLALQCYKQTCKSKGYKVEICQYADDGVIGGTHEEIIKWWPAILKEHTGCNIAPEKSHVARRNFKWLRQLKFLGLQYNPFVDKLYASTRKGSRIALDRSVTQFWGTWRSQVSVSFLGSKGRPVHRELLKTEKDNIYYMYEPEYIGDKRVTEICSFASPSPINQAQVYTKLSDGTYRRQSIASLLGEGRFKEFATYVAGGEVVTQSITWRAVLKSNKLNAFMARLYYGTMEDHKVKQDFTFDPVSHSLMDEIRRSGFIRTASLETGNYYPDVENQTYTWVANDPLAPDGNSDVEDYDSFMASDQDISSYNPAALARPWLPGSDAPTAENYNAFLEEESIPLDAPTPVESVESSVYLQDFLVTPVVSQVSPASRKAGKIPRGLIRRITETLSQRESALSLLNEDLGTIIKQGKGNAPDQIIRDKSITMNTFNSSTIGTYFLPPLLRELRRDGQSHWHSWTPLPKGIGPRMLHNKLLGYLNLEGYWNIDKVKNDPHTWGIDTMEDGRWTRKPRIPLRKTGKTVGKLEKHVDWVSAFIDHRWLNLHGERVRILQTPAGETITASRNYEWYRPCLSPVDVFSRGTDKLKGPGKGLAVMWGWLPIRPKRTHPDGAPQNNPISMLKHPLWTMPYRSEEIEFMIRWHKGSARPVNIFGNKLPASKIAFADTDAGPITSVDISRDWYADQRWPDEEVKVDFFPFSTDALSAMPANFKGDDVIDSMWF